MATSQEKDNEILQPRKYQSELFDYILNKNTIICMATGTGKTFIAIMLIKEKAHEVRIPFNEGGKLTFFITNTGPLAEQQYDVIREHVDLNVGLYTGEDIGLIDQWCQHPEETWFPLFRENQVFVVTPDILHKILDAGILKFSQINLLIFDECHHAKGRHPYGKIMDAGQSQGYLPGQQPQILGLTASLIDKKISESKLVKTVKELEQRLKCKAITAKDLESVNAHATQPDEELIEYGDDELANEDLKKFVSDLDKILTDAKKTFVGMNVGHPEESTKNRISTNFNDCLDVLYELGPLGASLVAWDVILKYDGDKKWMSNLSEKSKNMLLREYQLFEKFISFYEEVVECEDSKFTTTELIKPKVMSLVKDIILQYCPSNTDQCMTSDTYDMETDSTDTESEEEDMGTFDVHDYDSLEDEEEDDENSKNDNNTNNDNDKDEAPVDVSPKNVPEDSFLGIVFVTKRNTAYALRRLLEVHFCRESEFSDRLWRIESDYVIGPAGKKTNQDEQRQNCEKIKQTLERFREKKINLLIATSVLQEGIDIPKCNMVTMYDFPNNYREYVQSKGRARAKNSTFYIMSSTSCLRSNAADIVSYQEFEGLISSFCIERTFNQEHKDLEWRSTTAEDNIDNLLPAYSTLNPVGETAKITLSSAVSRLNDYCSSLPTDVFTKLTPQCTFEKVSSKSFLVVCKLRLPMNSPIKTVITGEAMKGKKLAQMAAALKACELLHKSHELTDYLFPVSKDEESKSTTVKNKQFYKKHVPGCSSVSTITEIGHNYLYEIRSNLNPELLNPDYKPFPSKETTRSFGIITFHEFPNLPEFPVYTRQGEELFRLKKIRNPYPLTEEFAQKLFLFERYLFKYVLCVEKDRMEFKPMETGSPIIVPLYVSQSGTCDIDEEFIDRIIAENDAINRMSEAQFMNWKTSGRNSSFLFNTEVWNDAVVGRTYKFTEQFFYVDAVRTDLRPLSNFPDDAYINFEEYYRIKYEDVNLKIKNVNQPLLSAKRVKLGKNMPAFKPRSDWEMKIPKETDGKERDETLLVPELCQISPFPGTVWQKAVCIPYVLHRLNQLCIAEEFRCLMTTELGIGLKDFPEDKQIRLDAGWKLEGNLKQETEAKKCVDNGSSDSDMGDTSPGSYIRSSSHDSSLFLEFEANAKYGPSTSTFLHALTMSHANELYSYERLETLGDSFLKFATTVYLYHEHPNSDEGKLTTKRIQQICNQNLYRLGVKKGLPGRMMTCQFLPTTNWLPPGYVIQKGDKETSEPYCMRTENALKDKNVADCVEALIGTYLLSCGSVAALKFMIWMGLDVNPIVRAPVPADNRECVDPGLPTSGLDVIERAMNYKFNNRLYLLQALTHSSYNYNNITDYYQRLEFLGDAVLDYVITRFLFNDSSQYSPGVLTDLKAALVNNNFFAKLSVKYKLHKSFKYTSSELCTLIHIFAKDEQKEESKRDEDVEVPKVLGDLFEAVAGAIYLDCGECLDTVWKIYYPIFRVYIDKFILIIPRSPVRELMETLPENVIFQKPYSDAQGIHHVVVKIMDLGTYEGTGRNARLAKVSAARKGLKAIDQLKSENVIMMSTGNPQCSEAT